MPDDYKGGKVKPFTFIEYEDAVLPTDPEVRSLIRRHAMRNVSETRRLRDNYGKCNIRQLPPWAVEVNAGSTSSTQSSNTIPSSPSPQIESHTDAPARIIPAAWQYLAKPPAPFPMNTSEADITENFAILTLIESLAGLHLGVNAQSSPTLRLKLYRPRLPQSKMLLSFIPSRYGHSLPLTYAVDCLAARLRQITLKDNVISEDRDLEVLSLYDKALRTLQEAINDEETRMTPETLCAAELLGFFELLDGSSHTNSWTRHAAGVAQLIQLQGTDRFRTEFELALIAAYVGPLVHEAFLNHKTCFLVDERWKRVIKEAICDNSLGSADCNNTVLSLWSHLIEGPNIFKEIVKIVLSSEPVPANTVQYAIDRLIKDLQELHKWLGMEYNLHNSNDSSQSASGNFLAWQINFRQSILNLQQQQHASWPILQGACIMSWLVKARLLTALSPSRFHDLETVCQIFAHEVAKWRTNSNCYVNLGLLGGLFMWQTVCIARVNCETNAIWTEGWTTGAYGRVQGRDGMIEKWKFGSWCKAIGLKVI